MNEKVFMRKYENINELIKNKGLPLRITLLSMSEYCKSRKGECLRGEEDECGFMPLCTYRPLVDDPLRCWAAIVRHVANINS